MADCLDLFFISSACRVFRPVFDVRHERQVRVTIYLNGNRKNMDDFDRFKLAASQIVGKRLTWNELTGKESTPTSVN